MFARITALAEDAAGVAVEGQGRRTGDEARAIAQTLVRMGQRISALSMEIIEVERDR